MIEVAYLYIKSIFLLFIDKSSNSKYVLAAKSFFKTYEFRYNENDRKSSLVILRAFSRILVRLKQKPPCFNDDTALVFDGNLKSIAKRIQYVKYFSGERNLNTLGLENTIYSTGLLNKYIQIAVAGILTLVLFPLTLFSKNRTNWSLIPTLILESYGLIRFCKAHKIKKVYYFCIFEQNANINAILLCNNKIKCIKNPSEVPLYFHNSIIIADVLCICFEYQKEEVEYFSKTMKIGEIVIWGPESILDVLNYKPISRATASRKIGYYSSAIWLRSHKGNCEKNTQEEKNEIIILNTLINFIEVNKDYELIVFLHPSEKRNEKQLKESMHFYSTNFNQEFFSFADINKPTNQLFEEINIAVSAFSTIVFERLYLGYKTILAPFKSYMEFPVDNSKIINIIARDEKQLTKMLEKNLPLTNELFFAENQINTYPINLKSQ